MNNETDQNPAPVQRLVGRHHDLRLWHEYYRAKEEGIKSWEYRVNDRDYSVGDTVTFHEWSHAEGYSGRAMGPFAITYIFNINNELCIFSHGEPNQKFAAISGVGPDQTLDTRPQSNPIAEARMREAVAAAESTAEEVEELRAAGPSRHAKALEMLVQERDALRTEADRMHEHLDDARATIARQSELITGLQTDLCAQLHRCESMAERLHRYEVDGEPVKAHAPQVEPSEPPLVKLGQGREDDEPSGPPLVGVLILGLIAVAVVVAIVVIATRTGGAR